MGTSLRDPALLPPDDMFTSSIMSTLSNVMTAEGCVLVLDTRHEKCHLPVSAFGLSGTILAMGSRPSCAYSSPSRCQCDVWWREGR